MKRSERRHLKENELSHAFRDATARLADQQRTLRLAGGIVAIALLAGVGYWAWHTRTETRAGAMLVDALTVMQSPVEAPKPDAGGKIVQAPGSYPTIAARAEAGLAKFNVVANAYPSTQAGIAARYYAAADLTILGRPQEAATRYQEVVDKAGTKDFYGRMAQLGVIESHMQAKQYDQAIAKAQALANATDDQLPRDAMLMELGKAYAAAGKKAEAKQTLDKVVTEFPESVFIDEAKALISTLT
jgi:TolA-binding protein